MLVVPQAAVRRVGQLSFVDVAASGAKTLSRRVVQLGRPMGADVEVLAGLQEGERVNVPQSDSSASRESRG